MKTKITRKVATVWADAALSVVYRETSTRPPVKPHVKPREELVLFEDAP